MVGMDASSGSDNVVLMILGVLVFITTLRVVARVHRTKRRTSARPPATVSRRRPAADSAQVLAITRGRSGLEARPADVEIGRRLLG
ncbi:hypothetical protein EV138_1390 [Kribbella voronezhensis]|uniref:Uncharacterized protein n=1 Tax=Kribbella voronezhensis TaxID=2512212 RepID=A0A4R7T9I3_9ACTN|nr:hypothetical protein [Kribbella voronezhensis]TDU87857.1 hypothetical protein EV138_1390 [Kribbella voronezhensis]